MEYILIWEQCTHITHQQGTCPPPEIAHTPALAAHIAPVAGPAPPPPNPWSQTIEQRGGVPRVGPHLPLQERKPLPPPPKDPYVVFEAWDDDRESDKEAPGDQNWVAANWAWIDTDPKSQKLFFKDIQWAQTHHKGNMDLIKKLNQDHYKASKTPWAKCTPKQVWLVQYWADPQPQAMESRTQAKEKKMAKWAKLYKWDDHPAQGLPQPHAHDPFAPWQTYWLADEKKNLPYWGPPPYNCPLGEMINPEDHELIMEMIMIIEYTLQCLHVKQHSLCAKTYAHQLELALQFHQVIQQATELGLQWTEEQEDKDPLEDITYLEI